MLWLGLERVIVCVLSYRLLEKEQEEKEEEKGGSERNRLTQTKNSWSM